MATCTSCGTNNVEGTQFCVQCGAALAPSAPPPESWRTSGALPNNPPVEEANRAAGGYAPQTPPSAYPTYTPSQGVQYNQPTKSEPMHPALPAVVSLFFPGLGLLFVPNKAGLGLGIFAGYFLLGVIGFILSFVLVGICVFMLMPLANVAAAVHSWDEAAKMSNGQFQPILFK